MKICQHLGQAFEQDVAGTRAFLYHRREKLLRSQAVSRRFDASAGDACEDFMILKAFRENQYCRFVAKHLQSLTPASIVVRNIWLNTGLVP